MNEEAAKIQVPYYYDARYGKYIRVIRSSDPVHVASIASTNVGAAEGGTTTALCSTTMDANTEGFVTSYGFSHSSTIAEMFFLIGSSTYLPQKVSVADGEQCQVTTIDAPFFRVGASQTVTAYSDQAGTVCAWLTMQKFPLITKVETDQF